MSEKKLAIFVEGQTEQMFLYKLISEIAGQRNVEFTCQRLHGGVLGESLWLKHKIEPNSDEKRLFTVLLIDCMGDETVKSTLLDQRSALLKKGYTLLLGLRDLYPLSIERLASVKSKLSVGVPIDDVETHILLAVSEVEAWFLQEYFHYEKISDKLDVETFSESFGFDPIADCAEQIAHPSGLLDDIYKSVGLRYTKTRKQVHRTVERLDYEHLYMGAPDKIPHLKELMGHLDQFLTVV